MKETQDTLISKIFPLHNGPKCQNQSINIEEIPPLFHFLQSPQNDQTKKCNILKELRQKLSSFRMFNTFFSTIDSQSIYIHLITLYLEKSTTQNLKKEILALLSELIVNLQTEKKIFDFIYQHLSSYYREEIPITPEKLNDILILLKHLYGDTELVQNPKNYIAAGGKCSIELNTDKGNEITFDFSLTFILNFRIISLKSNNDAYHVNGEDQVSDIIKLCYDNGKEFSISLNYPNYCVIKSYRDSFIKQFPNDEWINLIITLLPKTDGLHVYLFVNGENNLNNHIIKNVELFPGIKINNIIFFENFVGEIGSIVCFSQKLRGESGILVKNFLQKFKSFIEGYWKKKEIDKLLKFLDEQPSIIKGESSRKLKDDLVFLFSPLYSDGKILDDLCERYTAKLKGLLRIHSYFCFQKKVNLIGGIQNLFPILEMMYLHSECITEDTLSNFLSIITSILKSRKNNMLNARSVKLFETLSLFIERYPSNVFTEKILDAFFILGRTTYSEHDSPLSSIYFEEILFNEKILSKYTKNMQIKFWSQMELFCQSDKTQISIFLNMKKVSLILLSYDKRKYYQMCCEAHYNQIKPEYAGGKAIMNPPMTARLSDIEGIMKSTLDYQKIENAFTLFKLLTLDISPCLAKFIISVFTDILRKPAEGTRQNEVLIWKREFIYHFFNERCEVILSNTLKHCLLDVRIEIINLIYEMKKIPIGNSNNNIIILDGFKQIENILKASLLPGDIFYEPKELENSMINEISDLALHCVEKIKQLKTTFPCDKFDNKVIVFKDNDYQNFIMQVFNKFILWSLNKELDKKDAFEKVEFENAVIKNINIFQMLIEMSDKLKQLKFIKILLDIFEKLIIKPDNCIKFLKSTFICSWLLNMTYNNFQRSDEYAINNMNKGKGIIVDILINAIFDSLKHEKSYAMKNIEIIMIWGNSIINTTNPERLFEFINSIFIEVIKKFSPKVDPLAKFVKDKALININFSNKSYLILISILFQYYTLYKIEKDIKEKGFQEIELDLHTILLPKCFVKGMKIKQTDGIKTIEHNWIDYPFFKDLLDKASFIWSSKNTFKSHFKSLKSSKNKLIKNETIRDKLILSKDEKNLYYDELKILCYGEFEDIKLGIIPLIKIVPITIASIIQVIIDETKNENDLKYWLKQFRNFTRFIIIASTNLTPTNQMEYTNIETCCLREIAFAICFLKATYDTIKIQKNYLEGVFKDIMILIVLIIKSHFQYENEHSSKLKNIFKKARVELSRSAVISFSQSYVTDKKGSPLITRDKFKSFELSQYVTIIPTLLRDEYKEALFENQKLKSDIDQHFLLISKLCNNIKERYDQINSIKNKVDDSSYTYAINDLINKYETELFRYSNNSFIGHKEKKNNYKRIKKILFSWKGMWSDRSVFYHNNNRLKFKILNHYTKSFLRPVLVPILDWKYYLPNFTSFNSDKLFRDTNSVFNINLNIEEILQKGQSHERNQRSFLNESILLFNSFHRKIYVKSNPDLSYKYSQFIDKIELGKEEDLITMLQNSHSGKSEKDKGSNKSFYLCCFVKVSHHIKGVFEVLNDSIVFKVFYNQKTGTSLNGIQIGFTQEDEDYDSDRKTCFGSYFPWHHKDLDLNEFVLKFSEIKSFFRKRYYYKNSGIEFFSSKNKSYYFNFKYEEERELAINQILEKIKDKEKIIRDLKETKDKFENVIGYEISTDQRVKVKKVSLKRKLKSWTNWEISNLEMLMLINFFSNRSYLDISQYPVMPWVLKDYKDPLMKNNLTETPRYLYRNLTLPMGMIEDTEEGKLRKQTLIDVYTSLRDDPEKEMVPYVYGSHYSNPVYVCNYLTRVFPFSHIMIELSGNKFDNPDRLFLSISNAYHNSSTMNTDIRELIPEFFFLPEMFININNLNLGVLDNNELVHNVITPCANNPYDFVMTHRQILESPDVSLQINKWIDLIFGYKNRGKEAENAYNVFTEVSYEDMVDINKYPDKACLFRMVEFGLTPEQVISKECYSKKNKGKDLSEYYFVTFESDSKYDIKGGSVIKILMIDNDKIGLLFNDGNYIQICISYSILDKVYNAQMTKNPIKIKTPQSIVKMRKYYEKNTDKTNHVAIYNKGKRLAMGGLYDGLILLINIEPNYDEVAIDTKPENSPISTIEITKDELFALCGNERGNIMIFSIFEKTWKLTNIIIDHCDSISHIFSSDELNLWGSCSKDGYINIYTLPMCKNVRSIELPKDVFGDYIFLSSSPLPCIVIVQNVSGMGNILVYTLNGHFHRKQQIQEDIVKSPILFRDFYFNDYIAFIVNDTLYLRNLPTLIICEEISLNYKGISKLCVSEDMTKFYGVSEDGTNVKIIKDKKVDEISEIGFIPFRETF